MRVEFSTFSSEYAKDIYTVLVSEMLFLQELGPELGLSGLKCGRSVLGRCWCTAVIF